MADVYLPAGSQRLLMEIARQTLESVIHRCRCDEFSSDDPYLEKIRYGAFVTLFNQNELRGCIGTCMPAATLREIVMEMTQAAATRDRRVKPVRSEELGQIHIDISVVSPLERSDDPLSLEIGKHGLHISRGRKRGVLLPQVAVENRWDMETFLEQTCIKAGLPKAAWHAPDTVVSAFTALIIEEE